MARLWIKSLDTEEDSQKIYTFLDIVWRLYPVEDMCVETDKKTRRPLAFFVRIKQVDE